MELSIRPEDKILVVAPHPDDESIGCGGLLAMYGSQCEVLLLTDGRNGHKGRFLGKEEELVKIREEEFQKAMRLVGVKKIQMLHIPDEELYFHYNEIKKVDLSSYDYVFVTNRNESHEDHRMCYKWLKKRMKEQHAKAVLVEYEVWTPLTRPTRYLDITNVIDKKREMIEQHASQIADIDYAGKGISLSCYRGMYPNVDYAEAYVLSCDQTLKKRISMHIPKAWKKRIRNIRKKS